MRYVDSAGDPQKNQPDVVPRAARAQTGGSASASGMAVSAITASGVR